MGREATPEDFQQTTMGDAPTIQEKILSVIPAKSNNIQFANSSVQNGKNSVKKMAELDKQNRRHKASNTTSSSTCSMSILLINGNRHIFSFSPTKSIGEIRQYIFDHWPDCIHNS
jgi:hypothetical protein